MKRFLAFIAVALIFLAGCTQNQPVVPDGTLINTSNVDTVPSQPGSFGEIKITGFAFEIPELTVSAGTTIKWTNYDSVAHTVTSTGNFDSSPIAPGQSFAFKFDTAGTYDYHCNIHPPMKGTIIVK